METREQITMLEGRQQELMATLTKADAHALSCYKRGLVFAKEYPAEAKSYDTARQEYNANEVKLADLYDKLAKEEAEEQEHRPMEE